VRHGKELWLGEFVESGGACVIDLDVLPKSTFVCGAPGTGKTNIFYLIGQQLFVKEIPITGIDHKGELRRFTNRFDNVAVFRPQELPVNLFAARRNAHATYLGIIAAIARMGSLRAETWPAFPEVMLRLHAGLSNGEPEPSIVDVIAVLHALAKQGKPTLKTIARTLESFAAMIGTTAYVRRGPDLRQRFRGYFIEYSTTPPRVQQCLDDLLFVQTHLASMEEEHTSELREVLMIDEGMMVFHRNLNVENAAHYISPSARLIAMTRSTGRGVIVGTQSVSEIDPLLKANVATIICFRCPNVDDAWEMAKMLGLPKEAVQQIISLPIGVAYVRSEGFERAVLVKTPLVDMGPYPSDAMLAERLQSHFSWIAANTSYAPETVRTVSPLSYQAIVGETRSVARDVPPAPSASQQPTITEEFAVFLREVLAHPTASVSQHYGNLGWSPAKGNRVRQHLEEQGVIAAQRIAGKTGRPKEILSVTAIGRRLFGV
jgi:hypothetical protein